MKRLLIGLLLLGGLTCQKTNSGLSVTVQPNSPILITSGTLKLNGTDVTAPLFIANSTIIAWSGTQSLQLIDLELTLQGKAAARSTYSCVLAGDNFNNMFINNGILRNIGSSFGPVIPAVSPGATPYSVQAGGFYCTGIPLPSPVPESGTLSLNFRIKLTGQTIDTSTGYSTGRASGSTFINVR